MRPHSTSDPKVRSRQNLIGLTIHWTVYLVMAGMMFATNMATSPHVPWFLWSLFGWGIGLTAHTVSVLRFETLTEDEQRALLEREAARFQHHPRGMCGHGRRARCGMHQVQEPGPSSLVV
jgi:hypothetical protein